MNNIYNILLYIIISNMLYQKYSNPFNYKFLCLSKQIYLLTLTFQVSAIKKKLHVKGCHQDNEDKKYHEIDDNLNKLNKKIKDGNILDQGQRGANKVSAMAAHLATINKQPEQPLLQRSVSLLVDFECWMHLEIQIFKIWKKVQVYIKLYESLTVFGMNS